jgi:crotonobetainyl-CoA:carnitine CoA-transferase CaiB-like acyl-CoA transferase
MLGATMILGALAQRGRTGAGAELDVALMDGPLTWMAALGAFRRVGGLASERLPLAGGLPCYNMYATADGEYMTLAALEPAFWADFCQAAGRPDLIPHQNDPATAGELTRLFRSRPLADWLALSNAVDVCLEPVRTPTEASGHPQAQVRRAELGLDTCVPAPGLGAHTRELLGELAVTEAELLDLEQHHVVCCA